MSNHLTVRTGTHSYLAVFGRDEQVTYEPPRSANSAPIQRAISAAQEALEPRRTHQSSGADRARPETPIRSAATARNLLRRSRESRSTPTAPTQTHRSASSAT